MIEKIEITLDDKFIYGGNWIFGAKCICTIYMSLSTIGVYVCVHLRAKKI
jgi:hypothetical protein